jgi:hypothetical protein
MGINQPPLGFLDKLFIGLMAAIFIGVVVHAPATVWLGTLFPTADIAIKAWKEVLMVVAGIVLLAILAKRRQGALLKSWWVILPVVYVLLHIALVPVFFSDSASVIAGLLIDVRYVVYFAFMAILIQLYPAQRRLFIYLFAIGAIVVGVFALLQVFVLPPDFLKVIGYGDQTIQPYLTVDRNPDYVRISSTLRGPNPLGAFAVIGLSLACAFVLRGKLASLRLRWKIIGGVIVAGLVAALWYSYSRSAKIAAGTALAVVALLTFGRKINRYVWVAIFVVGFGIAGVVYAAKDTSFVSNVVLHENAETGSDVTSNDDHVTSLVDGSERLVRQPLGAGIGSTGSASLQTDQPLIIENQYLFIAHEIGWLGLALFLVLFGWIIVTAWRHRNDWLALGVFASGLGLALIGMLLPVWVDDTVSLIWWGLAGLVVGGMYERSIDKKTKRAA